MNTLFQHLDLAENYETKFSSINLNQTVGHHTETFFSQNKGLGGYKFSKIQTNNKKYQKCFFIITVGTSS